MKSVEIIVAELKGIWSTQCYHRAIQMVQEFKDAGDKAQAKAYQAAADVLKIEQWDKFEKDPQL